MNPLFDPAIALYTALAVALTVWIGIFIFLWRIDNATRELRRRLDEDTPVEPPAAPRATLETRNGHARETVSMTDSQE
jgi:hypothetical protein